MSKIFLKKYYVKSYSSSWTKVIFTSLPILGAFTLPIAHGIKFISNGAFSTDLLDNGMGYINPLSYDVNKAFFNKDNLYHIGLGAFNLSMIAQSASSLKNFITKFQQNTQKIIDVKINGQQEQVVAKGTLPISTYLGDLFMIGGTAGYFATDDLWGKVGFAAGGILGNIICKAIADDTNCEIKDESGGEINNSIVNSNINSNNTYIYNSNYGSTSHISNEAAGAMALILAIGGIYTVGYMLINDSTPGLYQYKFCDRAGRDLDMSIEWDQDGYHIFDKHGEEVAIV